MRKVHGNQPSVADLFRRGPVGNENLPEQVGISPERENMPERNLDVAEDDQDPNYEDVRPEVDMAQPRPQAAVPRGYPPWVSDPVFSWMLEDMKEIDSGRGKI
jgi:hypothetical protein